MTTTINEKTYEYRGLSTDAKPVEKAGNGSVFIEMDTGKVYIFDEENLIWIELSKKSGDSDIGSGESGGGASITSNIKIVANKDDILSTSDHNKLCILSNTGSLSFKVVDKIEGGSEEISTLSEVLPQALGDFCCATYEDNIYIFGGTNYSNSYGVNTIFKFNAKSKTISTLETNLPNKLFKSCCACYNSNIYIFGGRGEQYSNKILKFNCENETISTLSITLPKYLNNACCATYKDNIYIFGGFHYNSNDGKLIYLNTIYKFNCTTQTITTLSVTLPQTLSDACCSIYEDNVYIFGGYNGSSNVNNIYKFNCENETLETISTILPHTIAFACCSIYKDNIYIFGAYVSSALNNIYKFNCTSQTIEILSTKLSNEMYYSCCAFYEIGIFIFGGKLNYNNYYNTIYEFSFTFELAANNVLILNKNSNYSFDLITDQVTIPIKNIYIGDSTNTAQLANAYLYDETQTAWVNVNTGEVLS